MTQTFNRVKNSLVALLKDHDHKVIALTGRWGTGKTYLWRSVDNHLFGGKKANEQPIYISLFGVKTINDLKLRILQNTYLKDASTVKKVISASGSLVKEVIKKFTGYSAEDAALMLLPELTKGRLVVIDDVERKHKSLDIEEFLGMLDEYSETHNTRFLILLNTDKLNEKDGMWATLHEKVIDAEVVLDPSGSESFDIAAKDNASPYLPDVRAAVTTLEINNIRVIKRILSTVNRITDAMGSVSCAPAPRWVPSTVLLTASHYRAVEHAPPYEYILSFNSFIRGFEQASEERDPKELEWDRLLERLGISGSDTCEEILQQFLKSGLLDIDRLKVVFERYKKEDSYSEVTAKSNEFLKAFWWDPHCSANDLLDMARDIFPCINVLGPDAITEIVSVIEKLGDKALARRFLDEWLLSIETRPEYQQMEETIFRDSHQNYHPEVIGKMNEMRDKQYPPLTIIETAERIFESASWGDREKYSLFNSTIQAYENAIKQMSGTQLRRFLYINLEWARNPTYDENFKIGAANFVAASINIYHEAPNSRLAKMIHYSFEKNGLVAKLAIEPV